MNSSEDDIKKFDALENISKEDLSTDELKNIHELDQLMNTASEFQLSPDFTQSVVSSALIEKRKKSRFGFFSVLLGSMVAIVSLLWLAISLESPTQSTEYLPQVMNQVSVFLELFADPRVEQLLIISEAIILLIIADKVFSKVRNIRASAH